MTLDLPPSVLARQEFTPIEDVMLAILRVDFPDLNIVSLIPDNPTLPLVLVRGSRVGNGGGDGRFVDVAPIEVQVYVDDPDADEKGALISEAIRIALRDAWLSNRHLPGIGYVAYVEMTARPRAVSDWATSQGPVQYADLPSGVTRYESRYTVEVRRAL